jgi:hypothetical protein
VADDQKVVMYSILSTLLAATVIFGVTVGVSGGVAFDLVRAYVLPLVISAFTLFVFLVVLFLASNRARQKVQQQVAAPAPAN